MAKKPPKGELAPNWFCEGQTAIEDFLEPEPEPEPCTHPGRYFCPTVGSDECPDCGGFDICCAHPELHRPPICPHCVIPVEVGGQCYYCGDATWD